MWDLLNIDDSLIVRVDRLRQADSLKLAALAILPAACSAESGLLTLAGKSVHLHIEAETE